MNQESVFEGTGLYRTGTCLGASQPGPARRQLCPERGNLIPSAPEHELLLSAHLLTRSVEPKVPPFLRLRSSTIFSGSIMVSVSMLTLAPPAPGWERAHSRYSLLSLVADAPIDNHLPAGSEILAKRYLSSKVQQNHTVDGAFDPIFGVGVREVHRDVARDSTHVYVGEGEDGVLPPQPPTRLLAVLAEMPRGNRHLALQSSEDLDV